MIALFSFTIFGSVEAINDAAHILSVTDSVLDRLEELDRTDFIDRDGQEVKPERFDVEMDHIFLATAAGRFCTTSPLPRPRGLPRPLWGPPAPERVPSAIWWPVL